MSKPYTIEINRGITIVCFTDNADMDAVTITIDDLVENYSYTLRLWDLNKKNLHIDSRQLKEIARYGKSCFTKPSQAAIIAPKEFDFSSSQLFIAYRQDDTTVYNTSIQKLKRLAGYSNEFVI